MALLGGGYREGSQTIRHESCPPCPMDALPLNFSKTVRAEEQHHSTASTSATGPVDPVPQISVHVLIIPVIQAMFFLYMYKKVLHPNTRTSCLRAEVCTAASEAQWSVTFCPKPLLPIYFFLFFCSQCHPMHSHTHSTPQPLPFMKHLRSLQQPWISQGIWLPFTSSLPTGQCPLSPLPCSGQAANTGIMTPRGSFLIELPAPSLLYHLFSLDPHLGPSPCPLLPSLPGCSL